MIEQIFLKYLKDNLDVPVAVEHTVGLGEKCVIIEKTGSRLGNLVHTATFTVQSYAPTLYETAELNDIVKKVCLKATEVKNIFNVDLNSDYNFTDLAKKKYRYQAVYTITYLE